MVELKAASKRLHNKRLELEELSSLSVEARDPVELDQQSVGRLSRMDAMQQQAMSQATEQTRRANLLRIEAAERRLRDDEYGYCDDCGEEIPDARLNIDPMAERCIKCAS